MFIEKAFEWTQISAPLEMRNLLAKNGPITDAFQINLDEKIPRESPPLVPRSWMRDRGNLRRVEVVGDNSTVVGWLNGDKSVKSIYRKPVANILSWMFNLVKTETMAPRTDAANWFSHVYREYNKAPDALATMAILTRRRFINFDVTQNFPTPAFLRASFDGGFREGHAGAGIVIEAALYMKDAAPVFSTIWCAAIYLGYESSSSLHAELFGAEQALNAICSMLTRGFIGVDNDCRVLVPIEIKQHIGFNGCKPHPPRSCTSMTS